MVISCACGLFLFALRNTNKHFWYRCQGTVAVSSSNLARPCIFYLKKVISFIFFTMKPTSFQNLSASKGEFLEPLSKPNLSFGCELHPGLIAMVRAQPVAGHDNENPCHHLQKFEEMCSCLSISGMTQETLKWKLFPFSLIEKAKQWHTKVVESTNGD